MFCLEPPLQVSHYVAQLVLMWQIDLSCSRVEGPRSWSHLSYTPNPDVRNLYDSCTKQLKESISEAALQLILA